MSDYEISDSYREPRKQISNLNAFAKNKLLDQSKSLKKVTILVLGYVGVGKSQLVAKGVHEVLGCKYYPPGEDDSDRFTTHTASHTGVVDGIKFNFEIVDTGNRDYDSHNIKRANAIIFVCAYDSTYSLSRIEYFLEYAHRDVVSPVPMYVFANKCDLFSKDKRLSREEIEELATKNGCTFIETALFSEDGQIKDTFSEVLGFAVEHAEKYPRTESEPKSKGSKKRVCSIQ